MCRTSDWKIKGKKRILCRRIYFSSVSNRSNQRYSTIHLTDRKWACCSDNYKNAINAFNVTMNGAFNTKHFSKKGTSDIRIDILLFLDYDDDNDDDNATLVRPYTGMHSVE